MDKKKIIIVSAVALLAVTGVGLGIYAFMKSRKLKKQSGGDEKPQASEQETTPTPQPPASTSAAEQSQSASSPSASTPSASTPSGDNPFATTAEVNAFQKWVFDTKKEKVGKSDGTPDGKWGNKTRQAWINYGAEYTAFLNPPAAAPAENTWSVANYESAKEIYDLLKAQNQSVEIIYGAISWNTSGGLSKTVIVKFYFNGTMTVEKANYANYYAKVSGSWKKVVNGFVFDINGKSYKSEYTGQSVKDTVYSFLKDMNYYSWSDGSFVPMTKETCEFLNMTEDKNKQERIEVNF
jgi:hypothetical protein